MNSPKSINFVRANYLLSSGLILSTSLGIGIGTAQAGNPDHFETSPLPDLDKEPELTKSLFKTTARKPQSSNDEELASLRKQSNVLFSTARQKEASGDFASAVSLYRASQQLRLKVAQIAKYKPGTDLPSAECSSRIASCLYRRGDFKSALTEMNSAIQKARIPTFFQKRAAVYDALKQPVLRDQDLSTLRRLGGVPAGLR